MQILTSAKNPRVLAWRSLRDKKGRDAQDAFHDPSFTPCLP